MTPQVPVPRPAQNLKSIADLLACPSCEGGMEIEAERLKCSQCARTFPVVDGIPVLVAENTNEGNEA